MQKYKILIDARALAHEKQSGVEVFTINIIKYLKKIHKNIQIAKPKSKNKYLQHIWEHLKLPFLAKNYDILYSPANIAPIWTFKNTKLIVTLHDIAYLTHPKTVSKFFHIYYKIAIPLILKRADKVVTISKASKNEIIKHYPFAKDKIEIVYNGIWDFFFEDKQIEKENIILYVGSLNERKNFASVIEAFKSLPENLGYKLVIVGNFSENFAIKPKNIIALQRAKTDKNIIFYSNLTLKKLQELYMRAKIFIYPSFYEGFGFPLLEAMASKTPVITSNISSMPEICKDAALYVNPYDTKDISKKLYSLIKDENLQKELAYKGYKRASLFRWEKTAQNYLRLFEKSLKIK